MQKAASGLWHMTHHEKGRVSSRDRHTTPQPTSADEGGAQGDSSVPGTVNTSALDRARGMVKQASRGVGVGVGKVNKVESAGLLGASTASSSSHMELDSEQSGSRLGAPERVDSEIGPQIGV